MKSIKNTGFTIVETMLFLGISGLLITGILMGTGASLNRQRYRDSVSSLNSFIQQQFSEVRNVINNDTTAQCNGASRTTGQSNCVVLGRYITSNTSGPTTTLTSKNVIGLIPNGDPETNDVQALRQYNISISSVIETYTVEWGASIEDINDASLRFSILILRSPSSGIIRTFINTSPSTVIADASIGNLLVNVPPAPPTALITSAQMCINSNGMSSGKKSAIIVNAGATKGSDVNILGDGSALNTCQ